MKGKRGFRFGIIIILLFILVFISSAVSISDKNKISEEVYNNLEKNREVPVIITLKSENLISAEISEKELKELEKNPNIKLVAASHRIKAFLQNSILLINASRVWATQISGENITGADETVCLIDTGINFSHPDLIGKNKTCIIDCYNKNCTANCSIGDDNGHGTHAAGIAAASGGINGAAVNLGLIGVKVLDSDGNGHLINGEIDLTNAIDWCVENRNNYNISVISMSLGTSDTYADYCDSDFAGTLAKAIDNATYYNISVIAATGNSGSTTEISSPACVQNSTAVGAATKTDITAGYSNRNRITDLLAPGSSINSTNGKCLAGCTCLGSYMVCSGTSMATPHVAGAFALIRHFFRIQNGRVPTHLEIENALNNTGRIVDDTAGSGYKFSRINVFSAIISLDNTQPETNLIFPVDNNLNFSQNQTFSCNATDSVQLKNITLQIWDSLGNLRYNATSLTSGIFSEKYFDATLSNGNYKWNCLTYDANSNKAYASSNFSIYIGNISVSLASPLNNTHTNQNLMNFTCLPQTASIFKLTNATFMLWNSMGELINISNSSVSGISNSTTFWYNFTQEGNYSWNCLAYNNMSESALANANYTLVYDKTSPVINSVLSSATTTTAAVTWITDENSNSSISYGTSTSLGINQSSQSLITSHSVSLQDLSSSTTYYYNITSCDAAGNCLINGTYTFTTSAITSPAASSGGGGGGSAALTTPKIYEPTAAQLSSSAGYTQTLAEDDKIKFTFFDEKATEHSITLKEITSNSATILIQSTPILLTLGVGQSAKLNLSSADYYNFYIKLNSIKNNKADITMQTIYEGIPNAKITGEAAKEENKAEEIGENIEAEKENLKEEVMDKIKNILIIVLVMAVLGLLAERLI